jgi:hypothetical protein
MSEHLTAADFVPHVDKVFRVRGGHHGLRLTEVQAHATPGAASKALQRAPFTLIFAGPPADILREGLYTFEVEGGHAFELYVMPVHTTARDRQDYQAAFN